MKSIVPFPISGLSWSGFGFGFAVRTALASLIALYIAMRMNLDDPKWAAITVWVVAQSSRGMSLSKSQYRIMGTALGAVAARYESTSAQCRGGVCVPSGAAPDTAR
ncbi:FUSC family protein [Paraburkholderia silviterrae]|uniref:Fusaric acid resistance family protein n=1 Tax=Paraburkholderia silviterrae TaxID=2528715 RepID=A0A4R5M6Q1_9BURK|nr:hypothetical protein EYW47_20440 [Paraburkholderia silviterrae]